MPRRAGRVLWIASTPLALLVLLAAPPSRAEDQAEHGAAHDTHGALLMNPIQNFADFGYKKKQVAGGHHMPPPFSLALLNFGVLLFLVGKYAGPSMRRLVRERHEATVQALEEGKRLRDEARAKLEECSRLLANLDAEVSALAAAVRAEAEVDRQRILAEAQARADRLRRDAEQQIAAEIQRARALLEREAVLAAVGMAEQLLREKTGDAEQKALAERFVKSLESATEKRAIA